MREMNTSNNREDAAYRYPWRRESIPHAASARREGGEFRVKVAMWIWLILLLSPFPQSLGADYAVRVGEPVRVPYAEDLDEEMLYYLFEWGDGMLTPSALKRSGIHGYMEHRYAESGEYAGRYRAVSVSGNLGDWKSFSVEVAELGEGGERAVERPPVIASLGAQSTPPPGEYWQRQAYTLKLGGYYALDKLSIRRHPDTPFPGHFRIEYSINAGESWQLLNTANCFFFPDPGDRSVVFSFNGVVADAVRLLTTRSTPGEPVAIGGMEVTGERELLFDCSDRGPVIAGLNNMWYAFGSAVNEVHLDFVTWGQSKRPFEGGVSYMGNAEWMAWDALQFSWTDARELGELRAKWLDYPLDDDGFVWAAPSDPRHLFHNRHYDNNAFYIIGIVHYVLQTGDDAFLEHTCSATGKTNLAKLRLAMQYQLREMGGADGLLTIPDPEVQGTEDAKGGSNYWDYYKFGHRSAFGNAEFQRSLEAMAELERHLGNDGKAAEYGELAGRAKRRFNETFWNEETGRYAGWIGADGVMRDFGFTFVNQHALAHGLADMGRAEQVLDWLDGGRLVEGDTSTGTDIYHFGFGARANTVDMATAPGLVETWGGELHPARQGKFGTSMQNGGMIFYASYYDLHARLRYRGIDGAWSRLEAIMEEFEVDELRRMDSNPAGHTLIAGVLLCFPESGLVPMFYIDGVLGISPVAEGLGISPSLPAEWEWASVKDYGFSGRRYSVRVDRKVSEPRLDGSHLVVPAEGTTLLRADGEIDYERRPR